MQSQHHDGGSNRTQIFEKLSRCSIDYTSASLLHLPIVRRSPRLLRLTIGNTSVVLLDCPPALASLCPSQGLARTVTTRSSGGRPPGSCTSVKCNPLTAFLRSMLGDASQRRDVASICTFVEELMCLLGRPQATAPPQVKSSQARPSQPRTSQCSGTKA